MLGSGMMGSALTRALLKGGHDVMVFDLDDAKMAPLVADGAKAASDSVELSAYGDVLVPSLPSYKGLQGFLGTEGVLPALQGKTVVQLSSGSPTTVQEFGKFIAESGVKYLEGRIKNYPKDVGNPGSKIIFSGDEDVYVEVRPVLAALAEHLVFVSPQLEAVSALDQAVVTASYGQIWGMMLAGRLCQAYGVPPLELLKLVRETSPLNLEDLEATGYPDLAAGKFRNDLDTATITTWRDSADMVLDTIRAAGLDDSVFQGIQTLMRNAEKKGFGDRAIHAMADEMDA
ncbi:NAD(P)-dependent oxidoreductase [Rhodococcus qingshengii]|uniref:NAD(P)-dependent oxidoreductase n=1 Tax=Rhodococcus qingshengii TaxID=334542 RepID=UPI001BECC0A8|nr:NAD(P)-binding domain-containing protein [Rhodococcus qingshengii]MBT2274258.1 NAD(P)-dependent oxidoreductase [Rhodococcus qingshengii]